MPDPVPVNKVALRFVRDCMSQIALPSAFGLRLDTYFRKDEDEETLQAWFDDMGYGGVGLADIEQATAYFQRHFVGHWDGHYTLSQGNASFGELTIEDERLALDGEPIEKYRYDDARLSWEPNESVSHAGSLSFEVIGDAQRQAFTGGYFAKRVSGTITNHPKGGKSEAAVWGVTFGVSLDERAKETR